MYIGLLLERDASTIGEYNSITATGKWDSFRLERIAALYTTDKELVETIAWAISAHTGKTVMVDTCDSRTCINARAGVG